MSASTYHCDLRAIEPEADTTDYTPFSCAAEVVAWTGLPVATWLAQREAQQREQVRKPRKARSAKAITIDYE